MAMVVEFETKRDYLSQIHTYMHTHCPLFRETNAESLQKTRFPRNERNSRTIAGAKRVRCRDETRRANDSPGNRSRRSSPQTAPWREDSPNYASRSEPPVSDKIPAEGVEKKKGQGKKGKNEKRRRRKKKRKGGKKMERGRCLLKLGEFPPTITDPRNSCPTVVSHDVGGKTGHRLERAETWRDFAVWRRRRRRRL